MLIACLVVETIQRWGFILCQATVTLHQSQGHRNEHEHDMPCVRLPSNVTFAVETATPALDFVATSDAAPTEQPEDMLHGQTWPTDAYDDDDM